MLRKKLSVRHVALKIVVKSCIDRVSSPMTAIINFFTSEIMKVLFDKNNQKQVY